MKRFITLALIVLALTGCASADSPETNYSSQDIMFAEMMIPHHEQAIEMSELALARTANSNVLALAEKIRGAQEPEIELMKSWPGVEVDSHMGHTMMGMLDDEEMADRLFLEGMIKHHEGAIEMAEMVVDSTNPEVSELARSIIESQRAEIAEIKELLGK